MTTPEPQPAPAHGTSSIPAAVEREFAAAEHLLAQHALTHIPHPHLARRRAAGPVQTADHLPAGSALARLNTRLGVAITGGVGTMWCAYLFAALALISLPDAIKGGRSTVVSWVAQTFLQLVLLSIIMVGQNVQTLAGDARARATYEDGEAILHYADAHSRHIAELRQKLDEGLAAVHEKLDRVPTPAAAAAPVLDAATAAQLSEQLSQHLDKIAHGGNISITVPSAGDAAPAPATAPAPPATAPPPTAPADGPGSASTS